MVNIWNEGVHNMAQAIHRFYLNKKDTHTRIFSNKCVRRANLIECCFSYIHSTYFFVDSTSRANDFIFLSFDFCALSIEHGWATQVACVMCYSYKVRLTVDSNRYSHKKCLY